MADKNSKPAQCPYRDELPELFIPSEKPAPPPADSTSVHPFITFKQFIDDSFATFTGHNRPSFKQWKEQMQTAREEAREQELQRYWRWSGRNVSPDHDELTVQRLPQEDKDAAFNAATQLITRAAALNNDVDPARIAALYADDAPSPFDFHGPMLSFGGACYYRPETDDNLPSTVSLFGSWMQRSPRWLSFDWFKHSSYSPLSLEASMPNTISWRVAFEDLIDISLGKQMGRDRPYGSRHQDSCQSVLGGPGLDWVLSLQCRGVLPPMLPALYNNWGPVSTERIPSWTAAQKAACSGLLALHGPPSATRDLAELVREISTPIAPDLTTVVDHPSLPTFISDNVAANSGPFEPTPEDEPVLTEMDVYARALPRADSLQATWDEIRYGRVTQLDEEDEQIVKDNKRQFWLAVMAEDSERVAHLTRLWEAHADSSVATLIGPEFARAYVKMDTHPTLWAMCEGFEKADSKLYQNRDALQQLVETDEAWAEVDALVQQLARPQTQHPHEEPQWPSKRSPLEAAMPRAELHESHATPVTTKTSVERPMVLAALTTVQTTTLPDGTVTKKTVLKQRFSDGKEEVTESMEVEHPSVTEHKAQQAEKPQKKGWFWS